MCWSALQCVAVCCSVLQWVAVCCSGLQCVALWCNVLQCGAVRCKISVPLGRAKAATLLKVVAWVVFDMNICIYTIKTRQPHSEEKAATLWGTAQCGCLLRIVYMHIIISTMTHAMSKETYKSDVWVCTKETYEISKETYTWKLVSKETYK